MKLSLKLLLAAALVVCLASAASAAFGPAQAVRLVKSVHAKVARAARAQGFDPLVGVVDHQLLRMSKGCFTASDPETCAERCVRPLLSFEDDRCFPDSPFAGDESGDDSGASGEPEIFDLTDDESVDRFCECKGAYLRLMRTVASAMRCLTGESFNIEPLIDFLDHIFTFTCTKNGDEYCFELFRQASEFDNAENFGAENSTCADNSEILDFLGCCVRTTHDFIKNTDFEALNEIDFDGGGDDDDDDDDDTDFDFDFDFDDGAGGGDDDDDDDSAGPVRKARAVRPATVGEEDEAGEELLDGDVGFEVFRNALASCDKTIRDVTPCLAPGTQAVYTSVSVALEIDFSTLSSNATTMRNFRLAFVRDVAEGLGISPLSVSIVRIASGSTVVDFRVRADEASLSEVNSALEDGIELTRVNSELGTSITVDSDSATTKTETVKAEAINPASIAAPTFAVFALSALVALLL